MNSLARQFLNHSLRLLPLRFETELDSMTHATIPKLASDGLLLEGIVTTRCEDGKVNIAPMGPIVDKSFDTLLLRPLRTSTTYGNLSRTGTGVFHITDDSLLIAQAAVSSPDPRPVFLDDNPLVLASTCRWYAFKIASVDDSSQRSEMIAHTVDRGRLRDFCGFNRAKHAVLEAAILITRLHLYPTEEILAELKRLKTPVQKTGSAEEHEAFAFLEQHVHKSMVATHSKVPTEQ